MRQTLLLLVGWMLTCGTLTAQSVVSGQVTNATTGDPIQGASVLVKGTTAGVLTDERGGYRVQVRAGVEQLIFSFIGFEKQEVDIDGRTTINIALAEQVQTLDEVVVTAIGVERQKKALGYATQNISSEELNEANNPNAITALAGKVAGVQISSASGAVGGSSRIVIRGNRSFTGNNQPLFVVDGIPIDNSLFVNDGISSIANGQIGSRDPRSNADFGNTGLDINPNDIASINVLKGPAAAALYGSRAANGAIIITTKSGQGAAGRGRKVEVTFTSNLTFESLLRLPDLQTEYSGGSNGAYATSPFAAWGERMEGQTVANDLANFPGQPDSVSLQAFNAFDAFYETGRTWNNSLSLAGGDERSNYRLSFTDVDQQGIAPNTDLRRTTITARAGTKLGNKARTDFSITYTRSASDNIPLQGQNRSFVRQFLWNPPNVDWNVFRDFEDSLGNAINYTTFWENPYWTLNKNTISQVRNRINGFASFAYDLTPWLNVLGRAGTDFFETRRKGLTAIGTQGTPDGAFYEDELFVSNLTTDVIVTANKEFGDFSINALVGHNTRQRQTRTLFGEVNDIVIPNFYNFNNAESSTRAINSESQYRLFGVYGSASIGYRDFAFLEFTGRNDWSSTLPVENNSFFYPSVAASVVLTEAIPAIQSDALPYVKLRANWARVGNDAQPYSLQTVFPQARAFNSLFPNLLFPFGDQPGFRVGNVIGNSALSPEFTTSFEAGGELAFLSNRITLDVSYFRSETEGQIFNVNIAPSTGFTSQTRNAGLMVNSGVEAFLNIKPIYQPQPDGFRWNIGFNFSRINNEVIELFGDLDALDVPPAGFTSTQVQARPGFAYPSIVGRAFNRTEDGQLLIDPNTGRPTLADTFSVLGTAQPDFLFGISNSVSWKGIRLYALLDIRQGGQFYSLTAKHFRYNGLGQETTFGRDGLVVNGVIEQPDGSLVDNDIVVTAEDYMGGINLFGTSEFGLYDASFLKLREVSLSYSLPQSLMDRIPLSGIEISAVGRNLFLATPNPYIDPELNLFGSSNSQGYEYAQMPSTRSYGGTIKLTF